MSEALRTVFYPRHVAAGAKIVEFGGWDMPLQFEGILQEHLVTRKGAGLFDVSHMGRFTIFPAVYLSTWVREANQVNQPRNRAVSPRYSNQYAGTFTSLMPVLHL